MLLIFKSAVPVFYYLSSVAYSRVGEQTFVRFGDSVFALLVSVKQPAPPRQYCELRPNFFGFVSNSRSKAVCMFSKWHASAELIAAEM